MTAAAAARTARNGFTAMVECDTTADNAQAIEEASPNPGWAVVPDVPSLSPEQVSAVYRQGRLEGIGAPAPLPRNNGERRGP